MDTFEKYKTFISNNTITLDTLLKDIDWRSLTFTPLLDDRAYYITITFDSNINKLKISAPFLITANYAVPKTPTLHFGTIGLEAKGLDAIFVPSKDSLLHSKSLSPNLKALKSLINIGPQVPFLGSFPIYNEIEEYTFDLISNFRVNPTLALLNTVYRLNREPYRFNNPLEEVPVKDVILWRKISVFLIALEKWRIILEIFKPDTFRCTTYENGNKRTCDLESSPIIIQRSTAVESYYLTENHPLNSDSNESKRQKDTYDIFFVNTNVSYSNISLLTLNAFLGIVIDRNVVMPSNISFYYEKSRPFDIEKLRMSNKDSDI